MEMTDPDELGTGRFTLEELSDYLASGCNPPREEIDSDPEARHALAQLRRLTKLTNELTMDTADVDDETPWWLNVLHNLSTETRTGRLVPLTTQVDGAEHFITEGAIKALIRDAGDAVPGALLGRIRFDGDIEQPQAPVVVDIDVTIKAHTVIPEAAEQIRHAALESLSHHSSLKVAAINVTISDVFYPQEGDAHA